MSEENQIPESGPEPNRPGAGIPPDLAAQLPGVDAALDGVIIDDNPEHRPESQQVKEYPYDENMAGLLAVIYSSGYGIVAKRRGSHWNLSAKESAEHGKVTAQAIMHYFPNFDVGPGMMLFGTVSGSIGLRVLEDRKRAAAEAEGGGNDGAADTE